MQRSYLLILYICVAFAYSCEKNKPSTAKSKKKRPKPTSSQAPAHPSSETVNGNEKKSDDIPNVPEPKSEEPQLIQKPLSEMEKLQLQQYLVQATSSKHLSELSEVIFVTRSRWANSDHIEEKAKILSNLGTIKGFVDIVIEPKKIPVIDQALKIAVEQLLSMLKACDTDKATKQLFVHPNITWDVWQKERDKKRVSKKYFKKLLDGVSGLENYIKASLPNL